MKPYFALLPLPPPPSFAGNTLDVSVGPNNLNTAPWRRNTESGREARVVILLRSCVSAKLKFSCQVEDAVRTHIKPIKKAALSSESGVPERLSWIEVNFPEPKSTPERYRADLKDPSIGPCSALFAWTNPLSPHITSHLTPHPHISSFSHTPFPGLTMGVSQLRAPVCNECKTATPEGVKPFVCGRCRSSLSQTKL